jgi:hypothetical protein
VDLLVVNLEGPLCNDGPPRRGRTALLYNDPVILDWLASFPNCVCCLANNHIMDFGLQGLIQTRNLLSSRGIRFVGAGLNALEADRPLYLEVNGLKIAFLAFTSDEPHVGSILATTTEAGCSGLRTPDLALSRVSAAAICADVVIVLLHAGFEYFHYPSTEQVALTRAFVKAGATMVIGHHPHVQQGVERTGTALICHSLGNLLLPEMAATTGRIQYRKPITKQFAVLKANVGPREVRSWELIGGRCTRKYQLLPYRETAVKRFDQEMQKISKPLISSTYPEFWAGYEIRRKRELNREALRDAFSKLLRSNPASILRTLNLRDLTRNIRRLFGSDAI